MRPAASRPREASSRGSAAGSGCARAPSPAADCEPSARVSWTARLAKSWPKPIEVSSLTSVCSSHGIVFCLCDECGGPDYFNGCARERTASQSSWCRSPRHSSFTHAARPVDRAHCARRRGRKQGVARAVPSKRLGRKSRRASVRPKVPRPQHDSSHPALRLDMNWTLLALAAASAVERRLPQPTSRPLNRTLLASAAASAVDHHGRGREGFSSARPQHA